MAVKVLSNPVEDLKGLKLKAVVPNSRKLLVYIEDELVLDYDGTSTMEDEWHALHYKGKDYDLHIYFSEWCEEDPSGDVILYALEECDELGLQSDHSTYLVIPIEFGFDVRQIFMKQCFISKEWFEEDEGAISKEPSTKGEWVSFQYEP